MNDSEAGSGIPHSHRPIINIHQPTAVANSWTKNMQFRFGKPLLELFLFCASIINKRRRYVWLAMPLMDLSQ